MLKGVAIADEVLPANYIKNKLLITESASIEVKHMRRTKNIRVYEGIQARVDELKLFSVLNLQFVQRRFPNYLNFFYF